MRLSRAFPHLRLMADDPSFGGAMATSAASTPGARNKPAARAAAVAARQRRQRQFDFGAINPLISDADITAQQPGVSLEIAKTFTFAGEPFLAELETGELGTQLRVSRPLIPGLYVAGNMQGGRFGLQYPIGLKGVSHAMAMYYGKVAGENVVNGI